MLCAILLLIFLNTCVLHDLQAQSEEDILSLFKNLNLPTVTEIEVQDVYEGEFIMPATGKSAGDLPAHIRVCITSKPTENSDIKIEVWLPKENWNGRFLGTGNGGLAGSIAYWHLITGLRAGFAVANTDMGTSDSDGLLFSTPERWEDFGHRSTHQMTVIGKALATTYYKKKPSYSYFIGCSTGGGQALMEAQRYPDDYDGIIAGAPANNRTHIHTSFFWNYRALTDEKDCDCEFTREHVQAITDAIIRTNAGKDGGAPSDNFLTDPRRATFNPHSLQGTLSEGQIRILEKIYQGAKNPVTGEHIYTAFPLGSELYGSGLFYKKDIGKFPRGEMYPLMWSWGKDFDFHTFDFDKDVDKMDELLAHKLNANNPDLSTYKDQGGKLLMYTGTADQVVPFQDAAYYYERVIEKQGGLENTQEFFLYYVVPGMAHCGGGPGLNDFGQFISTNTPQSESYNLFIALIKWVEEGIKPGKIFATAFNEADARKGIRFIRPVYPYPLLPDYTGGDPANPDNYKPVNHGYGNMQIPAGKYLK